MSKKPNPIETAFQQLRWPLGLTRLGMVAERVTRAFWPLWSIIFVAVAALMFGLHELVPLEAVWSIGAVFLLAVLVALVWGIWRFKFPRAEEALDRLDRTLPGRPITALGDTQAVGAGDTASQAVWQAHVSRMADRVKGAKAAQPDLRVAARDPFALRYVAVLALSMAVLFGSVMRVASVAEMTQGIDPNTLATGPAWEGWIEPPAYTGKPSLYLNDIKPGAVKVPEASRLTLRFYGEVGALTLEETVSGRADDVLGETLDTQSFEIAQSGNLVINGPGGADWQIEVVDDALPVVEILGAPERGLSGEMRQTFKVSDDYGVLSGRVLISLNMDAVDRRHGLTLDPEPRDPILLDMPVAISGSRLEFEETLIENLSQHPWATLPISLEITAIDALGQEGVSAPELGILPGRRFFDPLAGAIIEQRRDLLWNRDNGPRIGQLLRAISHRADDVFDSETAYLKLRVVLRRIEILSQYEMSDEQQEEIAQALWDIALLIEDGSLADARARLDEARERLQEAMRNGATDEEIAELMKEFREAMRDYMQQLAEQQGEQPENGPDQPDQGQQEGMEMQQAQLQELMDRIQELMEQGRMDEAQQLMDQLMEFMENAQITQRPGEGGPGQEAMEGLADTLRQQQGLSDETFGDLQDEFNGGENGEQEGEQPGQAPGQNGDTGQLPGQGGAQGNGTQQGDGQGQGNTPGTSQESLSNRQQALREELNRQQGNMPGAGTPEGDAAREALDRAGRAMDEAAEALENGDLPGALDSQSEAIEALREGMRNLGEAIAQQQQPGEPGQQGDAFGDRQANRPVDPLGREPGSNGQVGTDEELLQGEDVYRRARELLDEIRKRSGDQSRTAEELEYLRRLLERF